MKQKGKQKGSKKGTWPIKLPNESIAYGVDALMVAISAVVRHHFLHRLHPHHPHNTGLATISQNVTITARNAGQPSANQVRMQRW